MAYSTTSLKQIVIANRHCRAVVLPDVGAGLASFDALRADGGKVALLRGIDHSENFEVFDLGCNLMLPWTNRISHGGFSYCGRRVGLKPNIQGEPMPIHGNALTAKWQVIDSSATQARLELRSQGPNLFDYLASVSYRLRGRTITIELAVTHKGDDALPYGIGFHPWFPRTSKTAVQAPAQNYWVTDKTQLPQRELAVRARPRWNFAKLRELPADPIDNTFTGWNRKALICWPEYALRLKMTASAKFGVYQLYAPSDQDKFFCLEPVSHLVDAHNRDYDQAACRLDILNADATLRGSMSLMWSDIGA